MIGRMQDLALKSLIDHLPILCDVVREKLPTRLKEVVLQRLSERDMITKEYVPVINKCLFVPELKHVNLLLHPEVTNEVIEGLAETPCRLRSLRISNFRFPYNKLIPNWIKCGKVKREGLMKRLLKKQSDLEVLEIEFTDMESCDFISEIKSSNLEEFKICVKKPMLLGSFTDGMENVAKNNGNLKKLTVKYLEHICYNRKLSNGIDWDDAIINTVKYIGANLKVFVVDSEAGLQQDTFEYIARYCPNLVSLILQFGDIWSAHPDLPVSFDSYFVMLPFKEHCQQLQNMVISTSALHRTEDDPDILYLPRNTRTFKLMPSRRGCSSNVHSFNISDLPLSLRELCIPMHLCEVDSVQALFTQLGPQLQNLDFPCNTDRPPSRDLEQTVMSCIIDHCINLSSLGLCCFYEASLDKLLEMFKDKTRSNRIHCLNLMGHNNIDPVCMSSHDSHIFDREMVKTWLIDIVESCANLRELTTNNSYIDNRLLASIALHRPYFTKLKISGLHGPIFLRNEEPGEDTISDDGLQELALKCHLEELHLPGSPFTRITGKCLYMLGTSCPYLQVLTICQLKFDVSHRLFTLEDYDTSDDSDTSVCCKIR
ncbi:uncharacterized protein LOC144436176 [Glandiceps talaboti]